MLDVFDRYLPVNHDIPRISQAREMAKYGMLYEVMEASGLKFQDSKALYNGTPAPARDLDEEILDA